MSNDFDELSVPYCVAMWEFQMKCQTERYEALRITVSFKGMRQEESEDEYFCIRTTG